MTPEYVVTLGQEALLLVLHIAGPMLIVALVVGLAVSILQAVTQVHEMTLTFIPKILAVVLVSVLFMPWIIRRIVDFTTGLLGSIPTVIG